MKLEFIKTDKCPVCGCTEVINESVETEFLSTKIRVHTNGGKWEYRRFACGYETHYCPNFRKEEAVKDCCFDPIKLEREQKRKSAKEKIISEIENLDVDDDYKTSLKSVIQYR